jgi:NADH-quinone oxidoreductase subunit M
MILFWIIVILVAAGVLAWASASLSPALCRWIALLAVLADFLITLALWTRNAGAPSNTWFEELDWAWVPEFGIHFHLALDGLSLLLLMLTFALGIVSVLASWTEITDAVGFFHLNLLWILAGIAGVFLAVDLFLFYFAWELMLVPMYFLIAIWGHENRIYAAVKFFIFTQLSGLLMLVAIVALYFVHHTVTGIYTFEYADLLGTQMSLRTEVWIMLGFFVAFAVKLPMFLLHTWLPDAHTEAPTAGSVILAGLLLKTGAYGMLRFVVPLFPDAAHAIAPAAIALGIAGILYGAIQAFGQTDIKRLVAYTSVSHLGFVLLAIFVWNRLTLQGALITIISHGISTGALFVLAGLIQERIHTREMDRMGGLWDTAPRLSGVGLFFALASLGLPGLGDFVGEFLILLGTYQRSILAAVLAAIGVLATTFYALRFVQRTFHGPNSNGLHIHDLIPREGIVMGLMMVTLLWLGLYPQPVLKMFGRTLTKLEESVSSR